MTETGERWPEEVGTKLPPEGDNGATPSSMMESLRQKHAQLVEGQTLDLPVPGYDGTLVARYRVLDVQNDLAPINRRVRQQFRSQGEMALYSTVDVLIAACVGLFYDDGERVRSLSESVGPDEPPFQYDDRLAEFLGLEAASARETVLQAFGGNEPAILDHGRQLMMWMSDTSRQGMEDFLAGM